LSSTKKILVIAPCFNESEALPHFINVLAEVLTKLPSLYQADMLLINDGSSDNTQAVIEKLADKYPNLYYREFAFNCGHQSALRAGINAADDYDAAIMLDADLQHPPELIPAMLKEWGTGTKIVQMVRNDSSQDAGLFKYMTSKAYYRLINWISDLKLDYGASDFRLIDQAVIASVATSKEKDLFLRGYFSWLKVPSATIAYKPSQRVAGTSKYSFKKMLDLAYKGILQFSEKPLQVAMSLGAITALLSFLYGIVLVIRYLLGDYSVSGWTSLMVLMLFCFGVSFMLLGIIGTYLAHLIRIVKQRPEYIISAEKLPKPQAQAKR
jgi:dolichol-phosphate mannosyltransferase